MRGLFSTDSADYGLLLIMPRPLHIQHRAAYCFAMNRRVTDQRVFVSRTGFEGGN